MTTATIPVLRSCCGPDCGANVAKTKFDDKRVEQQAAALQALGDDTRLKMVHLLTRHESLCVCEIQEAFELGQPTVSHHLKILRDAGLVNVARRGKWAYYALRRDALRDISADIGALI